MDAVRAARSHARSDALGRAPLLHECVGRVPASRRQHGYAGGGRHGGGIRVLRGRDVRTDRVHESRARAQPVLRARDHHHRAHSHGQRIRGARQATDLDGAPRAGPAATEDGANRARRSRGRRAHRGGAEWRRRDRAARRTRSGGRRGALRRQRGGRVHAHRRVGPGAEGHRRPDDRWDDQSHRRAALPRHDARRRQRAGADRSPDARCAGNARANPGAGRSRERDLRSCRDVARDPDLRRLVPVGASHRRIWRHGRGARLRERGDGADHRVPMRDGARGAHRRDGRDGQGSGARHPDQGRRSAAARRRRDDRAARQDWHGHRGAADGDRRRARRDGRREWLRRDARADRGTGRLARDAKRAPGGRRDRSVREEPAHCHHGTRVVHFARRPRRERRRGACARRRRERGVDAGARHRRRVDARGGRAPGCRGKDADVRRDR